VLVVDHDLFFYGSQQYLYRQAPGLERRGVELILAGPANGDLGRVWRESGRQHLPIKTIRYRGLTTESGRPSPVRMVRELYRVLRGAWRTARLARRVGADVIAANSYGWAFNEVVLAGWLARRPTVVHLHMQVESGPVRYARAAAVLGASATIAVSDAVVRSLPHRARHRVHVVQSGVDTERFAPGPARPGLRAELASDPKAPVILVMARLVPGKGIDDVIQAIASLPDHLGHTQLAVAGGAPDPNYEATLRQLGTRLLSDRVRFLGNRVDVSDLLRAADVLVLASAAEGLGLCVLEAQATGTPSIAYPAGGTAELIDHEVTGLLARQGDHHDLAHQLTRLLDDSALAERLTDAAREQVLRLRTMDSQADAHAAILDQVWPRRRQGTNL
jgi:glycosyltransferase involved in cell wall biosynthesis